MGACRIHKKKELQVKPSVKSEKSVGMHTLGSGLPYREGRRKILRFDKTGERTRDKTGPKIPSGSKRSRKGKQRRISGPQCSG